MLVNRAEFIIFMQSRVPLGPGKFHLVVLVWVEMFKIFAVFYRGEKLFFIWSELVVTNSDLVDHLSSIKSGEVLIENGSFRLH